MNGNSSSAPTGGSTASSSAQYPHTEAYPSVAADRHANATVLKHSLDGLAKAMGVPTYMGALMGQVLPYNASAFTDAKAPITASEKQYDVKFHQRKSMRKLPTTTLDRNFDQDDNVVFWNSDQFTSITGVPHGTDDYRGGDIELTAQEKNVLIAAICPHRRPGETPETNLHRRRDIINRICTVDGDGTITGVKDLGIAITKIDTTALQLMMKWEYIVRANGDKSPIEPFRPWLRLKGHTRMKPLYATALQDEADADALSGYIQPTGLQCKQFKIRYPRRSNDDDRAAIQVIRKRQYDYMHRHNGPEASLEMFGSYSPHMTTLISASSTSELTPDAIRHRDKYQDLDYQGERARNPSTNEGADEKIAQSSMALDELLDRTDHLHAKVRSDEVRDISISRRTLATRQRKLHPQYTKRIFASRNDTIDISSVSTEDDDDKLTWAWLYAIAEYAINNSDWRELTEEEDTAFELMMRARVHIPIALRSDEIRECREIFAERSAPMPSTRDDVREYANKSVSTDKRDYGQKRIDALILGWNESYSGLKYQQRKQYQHNYDTHRKISKRPVTLSSSISSLQDTAAIMHDQDRIDQRTKSKDPHSRKPSITAAKSQARDQPKTSNGTPARTLNQGSTHPIDLLRRDEDVAAYCSYVMQHNAMGTAQFHARMPGLVQRLTEDEYTRLRACGLTLLQDQRCRAIVWHHADTHNNGTQICSATLINTIHNIIAEWQVDLLPDRDTWMHLQRCSSKIIQTEEELRQEWQKTRPWSAGAIAAQYPPTHLPTLVEEMRVSGYHIADVMMGYAAPNEFTDYDYRAVQRLDYAEQKRITREWIRQVHLLDERPLLRLRSTDEPDDAAKPRGNELLLISAMATLTQMPFAIRAQYIMQMDIEFLAGRQSNPGKLETGFVYESFRALPKHARKEGLEQRQKDRDVFIKSQYDTLVFLRTQSLNSQNAIEMSHYYTHGMAPESIAMRDQCVLQEAKRTIALEERPFRQLSSEEDKLMTTADPLSIPLTFNEIGRIEVLSHTFNHDRLSWPLRGDAYNWMQNLLNIRPQPISTVLETSGIWRLVNGWEASNNYETKRRLLTGEYGVECVQFMQVEHGRTERPPISERYPMDIQLETIRSKRSRQVRWDEIKRSASGSDNDQPRDYDKPPPQQPSVEKVLFPWRRPIIPDADRKTRMAITDNALTAEIDIERESVPDDVIRMIQKDRTATPIIINPPPLITVATPIIVNSPPLIADATPTTVNSSSLIADATPTTVNSSSLIADATPITVNSSSLIADATPITINSPPLITAVTPTTVNSSSLIADATPITVNSSSLIADMTPITVNSPLLIADVTPTIISSPPLIAGMTPVIINSPSFITDATSYFINLAPPAMPTITNPLPSTTDAIPVGSKLSLWISNPSPLTITHPLIQVTSNQQTITAAAITTAVTSYHVSTQTATTTVSKNRYDILRLKGGMDNDDGTAGVEDNFDDDDYDENDIPLIQTPSPIADDTDVALLQSTSDLIPSTLFSSAAIFEEYSPLLLTPTLSDDDSRAQRNEYPLSPLSITMRMEQLQEGPSYVKPAQPSNSVIWALSMTDATDTFSDISSSHDDDEMKDQPSPTSSDSERTLSETDEPIPNNGTTLIDGTQSDAPAAALSISIPTEVDIDEITATTPASTQEDATTATTDNGDDRPAPILRTDADHASTSLLTPKPVCFDNWPQSLRGMAQYNDGQPSLATTAMYVPKHDGMLNYNESSSGEPRFISTTTTSRPRPYPAFGEYDFNMNTSERRCPDLMHSPRHKKINFLSKRRRHRYDDERPIPVRPSYQLPKQGNRHGKARRHGSNRRATVETIADYQFRMHRIGHADSPMDVDSDDQRPSYNDANATSDMKGRTARQLRIDHIAANNNDTLGPEATRDRIIQAAQRNRDRRSALNDSKQQSTGRAAASTEWRARYSTFDVSEPIARPTAPALELRSPTSGSQLLTSPPSPMTQSRPSTISFDIPSLNGLEIRAEQQERGVSFSSGQNERKNDTVIRSIQRRPSSTIPTRHDLLSLDRTTTLRASAEETACGPPKNADDPMTQVAAAASSTSSSPTLSFNTDLIAGQLGSHSTVIGEYKITSTFVPKDANVNTAIGWIEKASTTNRKNRSPHREAIVNHLSHGYILVTIITYEPPLIETTKPTIHRRETAIAFINRIKYQIGDERQHVLVIESQTDLDRFISYLDKSFMAREKRLWLYETDVTKHVSATGAVNNTLYITDGEQLERLIVNNYANRTEKEKQFDELHRPGRANDQGRSNTDITAASRLKQDIARIQIHIEYDALIALGLTTVTVDRTEQFTSHWQRNEGDVETGISSYNINKTTVWVTMRILPATELIDGGARYMRTVMTRSSRRQQPYTQKWRGGNEDKFDRWKASLATNCTEMGMDEDEHAEALIRGIQSDDVRHRINMSLRGTAGRPPHIKRICDVIRQCTVQPMERTKGHEARPEVEYLSALAMTPTWERDILSADEHIAQIWNFMTSMKLHPSYFKPILLASTIEYSEGEELIQQTKAHKEPYATFNKRLIRIFTTAKEQANPPRRRNGPSATSGHQFDASSTRVITRRTSTSSESGKRRRSQMLTHADDILTVDTDFGARQQTPEPPLKIKPAPPCSTRGTIITIGPNGIDHVSRLMLRDRHDAARAEWNHRRLPSTSLPLLSTLSISDKRASTERKDDDSAMDTTCGDSPVIINSVASSVNDGSRTSDEVNGPTQIRTPVNRAIWTAISTPRTAVDLTIRNDQAYVLTTLSANSHESSLRQNKVRFRVDLDSPTSSIPYGWCNGKNAGLGAPQSPPRPIQADGTRGSISLYMTIIDIDSVNRYTLRVTLTLTTFVSEPIMGRDIADAAFSHYDIKTGEMHIREALIPNVISRRRAAQTATPQLKTIDQFKSHPAYENTKAGQWKRTYGDQLITVIPIPKHMLSREEEAKFAHDIRHNNKSNTIPSPKDLINLSADYNFRIVNTNTTPISGQDGLNPPVRIWELARSRTRFAMTEAEYEQQRARIGIGNSTPDGWTRRDGSTNIALTPIPKRWDARRAYDWVGRNTGVAIFPPLKDQLTRIMRNYDILVTFDDVNGTDSPTRNAQHVEHRRIFADLTRSMEHLIIPHREPLAGEYDQQPMQCSRVNLDFNINVELRSQSATTLENTIRYYCGIFTSQLPQWVQSKPHVAATSDQITEAALLIELPSRHHDPISVHRAPDGSWRISDQDYWPRDDVLRNANAGVTTFTSVLRETASASYFSIIDISDIYDITHLTGDVMPLQAVVTRHGHLSSYHLPTTARGALTRSQDIARHALRKLLNKTCIVYRNSIIIYTTGNIDRDHINDVGDVMKQLLLAGVSANITKSLFGFREALIDDVIIRQNQCHLRQSGIPPKLWDPLSLMKTGTPAFYFHRLLDPAAHAAAIRDTPNRVAYKEMIQWERQGSEFGEYVHRKDACISRPLTKRYDPQRAVTAFIGVIDGTLITRVTQQHRSTHEVISTHARRINPDEEEYTPMQRDCAKLYFLFSSNPILNEQTTDIVVRMQQRDPVMDWLNEHASEKPLYTEWARILNKRSFVIVPGPAQFQRHLGEEPALFCGTSAGRRRQLKQMEERATCDDESSAFTEEYHLFPATITTTIGPPAGKSEAEFRPTPTPPQTTLQTARAAARSTPLLPPWFRGREGRVITAIVKDNESDSPQFMTEDQFQMEAYLSMCDITDRQHKDPVLREIIAHLADEPSSDARSPKEQHRLAMTANSYVLSEPRLDRARRTLFRKLRGTIAAPSVGIRLAVPLSTCQYLLQLTHAPYHRDTRRQSLTHFGVRIMIDKLQRFYHWDSLVVDAYEYIDKCGDCVQQTIQEHARRDQRKQYGIATHPYDIFTVEYISQLPETADNETHLLIVTDHFSKFSMTRAVKDTTVPTAVDAILKHIIRDFGPPSAVMVPHSMQAGLELASHLRDGRYRHKKGETRYMQAEPTRSGIGADWKLETKDQAIQTGTTWPTLTNWLTHLHNVSINAITGYTPHWLLYGTEADGSATPQYQQGDSKQRLHTYQKGERVWVRTRPTVETMGLPFSNHVAPYIGPYYITCRTTSTLHIEYDVIPDQRYDVEQRNGATLSKMLSVHVGFLRPYTAAFHKSAVISSTAMIPIHPPPLI